MGEGDGCVSTRTGEEKRVEGGPGLREGACDNTRGTPALLDRCALSPHRLCER
jgi:hypothetical protein